MQIGTKQIIAERRERGRVPHRRHDHLDDAGFTVDKNGETIEEQTEMVLIQSKTLTAKDPAFRAAIADVDQDRQRVPGGERTSARRSIRRSPA